MCNFCFRIEFCLIQKEGQIRIGKSDQRMPQTWNLDGMRWWQLESNKLAGIVNTLYKIFVGN